MRKTAEPARRGGISGRPPRPRRGVEALPSKPMPTVLRAVEDLVPLLAAQRRGVRGVECLDAALRAAGGTSPREDAILSSVHEMFDPGNKAGAPLAILLLETAPRGIFHEGCRGQLLESI